LVPFGNFGWNFGFGFGWLIVIVSFILIVLAIVRLVRMGSGPGRRTSLPEETPLDVLKKKYARGEITKEEFETKKKEIL
jgi:putative membrane protein